MSKSVIQNTLLLSGWNPKSLQQTSQTGDSSYDQNSQSYKDPASHSTCKDRKPSPAPAKAFQIHSLVITSAETTPSITFRACRYRGLCMASSLDKMNTKGFSGDMHPASNPLLRYTLPWLYTSRRRWISHVMKRTTSTDKCSPAKMQCIWKIPRLQNSLYFDLAYYLDDHNLGSAVSDRSGVENKVGALME